MSQGSLKFKVFCVQEYLWWSYNKYLICKSDPCKQQLLRSQLPRTFPDLTILLFIESADCCFPDSNSWPLGHSFVSAIDHLGCSNEEAKAGGGGGGGGGNWAHWMAHHSPLRNVSSLPPAAQPKPKMSNRRQGRKMRKKVPLRKIENVAEEEKKRKGEMGNDGWRENVLHDGGQSY